MDIAGMRGAICLLMRRRKVEWGKHFSDTKETGLFAYLKQCGMFVPRIEDCDNNNNKVIDLVVFFLSLPLRTWLATPCGLCGVLLPGRWVLTLLECALVAGVWTL